MKKTHVTLGIALFFSLLSALFFNACSSGGGGGSASGGGTAHNLSGKAVAGAPIIGTVTIKDSSNPAKTKFSLIEADGDYTIDVSDMTGPFMLRADGTVGGRSYSIYSGATSADVNGNVNVTPLTDLIVANIAGQLASTYFNSGSFSTMTTTQLNTEADALKARLLPILAAIGVSSSIDLLRTSFSSDHTGLDAALDILKVETDPATGIATITNVINNSTLTNNPALPTTTTADATGVTSGLTDLQAIVAQFNTFAQLFATSVPSPSNPTLTGMFDAGFLNDGEGLGQFLTEITSDDKMIGLKFSNISLVSITASTATVQFTPVQSGSNEDAMTFDLVKSSGIWKILGNGRLYRAEVATFARLQDVWISSTFYPNHIDTGLRFEIKDPSNQGVDFAIVSGPGLPAHTAASATGGALYFKEMSNNSFDVATLGATYNGSPPTPINDYGNGQIPMDDTTIGQISDGDTYSVELWKWNGGVSPTVLATYNTTLSKKPYLNSELAISSFGTITAPTKSGLMTVASTGGTLHVTWTIPSGFHSSEVSFYDYGNGSGTTTVDVMDNVAGTATSHDISLTAPDVGFGTVQGADIDLFVRDQFNRELITIMISP